MLAMAKDKSESRGDANRSRDTGEVVPFTVELSKPLYDALGEASKVERRTKRVIVETALEAYFKSTGVMPKK
jgi:hypothetical protein